MLFEEISLNSVKNVHILQPLIVRQSGVSLESPIFNVIIQKFFPKILGKVVMFDEHAKQRITLLFVQAVLGKGMVEIGDNINIFRRLSELNYLFEELLLFGEGDQFLSIEFGDLWRSD